MRAALQVHDRRRGRARRRTPPLGHPRLRDTVAVTVHKLRVLRVNGMAERGGSDQALLHTVRSLPQDQVEVTVAVPAPQPLAAAGPPRAARFGWLNAARALWMVYAEVARRRA
jgi:hypothetical protein